MALFDLFGKREPSALTLDAATLNKWPDRLLRRQKLHDALDIYVNALDKHRDRVEKSVKRVSDPGLADQRVPERAREVYDEHLPTIRAAAYNLLDRTIVVGDLFLIEAQQEEFQQALADFKEGTQKSTAALKEFFDEELAELNESVRILEDGMLSIYPKLEEGKFSNIKAVKRLIDEFKETREKEQKLKLLHKQTLDELDAYEARRLKHKDKIQYFTERARDGKFKELIAEEGELLDQADEIKIKGLPAEEEAKLLEPIKQRLSWLRKQMINDITAMNINEQRTFLESAKDEIWLRKKKLERIEEMLGELSFETYKAKLIPHIEPFNARIEDADMILEREEDDVAPQ